MSKPKTMKDLGYRFLISALLCTSLRFLVHDNLVYVFSCLGGAILLACVSAYIELRVK